MRNRSRQRGNTGFRWKPILVVVIILLSLPPLIGVGFSTSAFSSMMTDRSATIEVTVDGKSVLELDKQSSVAAGDTSTLVNVTNNFERSMSITIELRKDSQDDADLVIDGSNRGESATITLADGATKTVKVKVKVTSKLTDDTIYFDSKASETSVSAQAKNRTVPIN